MERKVERGKREENINTRGGTKSKGKERKGKERKGKERKGHKRKEKTRKGKERKGKKRKRKKKKEKGRKEGGRKRGREGGSEIGSTGVGDGICGLSAMAARGASVDVPRRSGQMFYFAMAGPCLCTLELLSRLHRIYRLLVHWTPCFPI